MSHKLVINEAKGTFTLTGEITEGSPSKSGKTLVVATTSGFQAVKSDKGNDFKVAVNIIKPYNNYRIYKMIMNCKGCTEELNEAYY